MIFFTAIDSSASVGLLSHGAPLHLISKPQENGEALSTLETVQGTKHRSLYERGTFHVCSHSLELHQHAVSEFLSIFQRIMTNDGPKVIVPALNQFHFGKYMIHFWTYLIIFGRPI